MDQQTILVVEDDSDDLELIKRAMSKARISNHLTVVRDGVEALDYLLDGELPLPPLPSVMLLDIKLPRVDGLEVLRRVRAHLRTKMLPIVILTSSNEQEDIIRSYDLGVNSYVRKPIDLTSFVNIVGQLGLYWLLVNQTLKVQ